MSLAARALSLVVRLNVVRVFFVAMQPASRPLADDFALRPKRLDRCRAVDCEPVVANEDELLQPAKTLCNEPYALIGDPHAVGKVEMLEESAVLDESRHAVISNVVPVQGEAVQPRQLGGEGGLLPSEVEVARQAEVLELVAGPGECESSQSKSSQVRGREWSS